MYYVAINSFSGNITGNCEFEYITDAMETAKNVGYGADVMDGSTGEILYMRRADKVLHSIF